MTTTSLTISRVYAVVLIGALSVHALIVGVAVADAFGGKPREDYDIWEFVGVVAIAFALSWVSLKRWKRHASAVISLSVLVSAAALASPGAVVLVGLMLLNAYVVGERLLGWVGAGSESSKAELPFSITGST